MRLVIAVLASGCNRPAGHNLWNDDEVVALLEKHPSVEAFFGGHNHAGDCASRAPFLAGSSVLAVSRI